MESPDNPNQMIEHLQPSVLVIMLRLLSAVFIVDTVYAMLLIGFFALNNIHEWHNSYIGFLLLVHAVKYILMSFAVIQLFAQWAGRNYYLSGHHLIERLGLVNITETTYELSQIKSLAVNQSWFARRFNYGTIRLSLAGAGKQQTILLRDINNPGRYKNYIEQHLQVQGWVR